MLQNQSTNWMMISKSPRLKNSLLHYFCTAAKSFLLCWVGKEVALDKGRAEKLELPVSACSQHLSDLASKSVWRSSAKYSNTSSGTSHSNHFLNIPNKASRKTPKAVCMVSSPWCCLWSHITPFCQTKPLATLSSLQNHQYLICTFLKPKHLGHIFLTHFCHYYDFFFFFLSALQGWNKFWSSK